MEPSLKLLTILKLQVKLRKLNLPVSGNKSTLITRITDFEKYNFTPYKYRKIPQLKTLLRERDLPVFGSKQILVKRLYYYDYDASNRIFLTELSEDIDIEILLTLDDRDLTSIFLTNKRAEKICNNDHFWNLRIQRVCGLNLSKYKNDKTYKEIYIELTNNNDPFDKNRKQIDQYLFRASRAGYLSVVQYLIENRADVTIHDEYYDSCIWAANNGHLTIVQYLIEQCNADIHTQDDDALIWASKHGHLEVVQYLIEQGANVHAQDDFALRMASFRGHLSIVKYLIEKGAEVNGLYEDALRGASRQGHLPVVKHLIAHSANIHADNDGALRLAVQRGHLHVVQCLIENGADVNGINVEALRWMSINDHLPITKYLSKYIKTHPV